MNNLRQQYKEKIVPALKKKFGYKNVHQIPTLDKVVLNVGVGSHLKDKDYFEAVSNTLARITGQKAVLTKSKKSVSNFKIRTGMVVGVSVTLRKERMWDFIEKIVKVTLPRVRDFRGITTKSFDQQGNYSVGFKEYLPFPEVSPDEIETLHGLEVVINTTAINKEEGEALLTELGFPFKEAK
ncbi:50S ribosomal protein L5 [Candidatus Falkowbacteria bacterium CG10_big_fil_rev_8_21_14_0_10_39_11]|uniref:Large ribosomal subunit protein uL5 n=1 Tax=Candidatus Falkowbacteria bacterium CG10_big_fil_rev_8_21_14_0_10_39_11 TaxID=1974565 RepID=A0A2H0V3T3_9BACT|nr:MAG: 50S ribosomal protein L5 [Candidatus Falkowbacteria bacterium CG10_big_fil_rev_8_21_14_0_10_39_11]